MKNYKASLLRALCLFALTVLFWNHHSSAQVIDIINNPQTTGNCPLGTNLYAASEAIYTETEIGATNFTTAATAINEISINIFTAGAATTFTNVTIWMKDVPLPTTTFETGTYSTAGYTQVFTGSVSAPGVGWAKIPLTTLFQRTSGTNLQVLIERKDGVTHTDYVYWSANGNNTDDSANTCRRYNNINPLSATTSLIASAYRPQIRLQHEYFNDALVKQVYTLGKLPVPYSTPHSVRANIENTGVNALTNVQVTLNITGANIFTDVQTIPALAAGANANVTFVPFTPTVMGSNNVAVSIPADDFNGNNSKSVTQLVNDNTFSYAYDPLPDGSIGFGAPTYSGDIVAKYSTSVNTAISQVSVYFVTGGQTFQVGIWDATGAGGTPGNLLFTSGTQISTEGIYVLPVLPAVPITTGDFFVGVRQVDSASIRFAYQTEDPVRPNTFYQTVPTGGTTWTPLTYRFMIRPKLQIPIDANLTDVVTPSAACHTGSVSYSVVLSNVGLSDINAGAANVTLKISGANVYNATVANTAGIASGRSAIIHFDNINLTNPGVNTDTVFVTLPGDTEHANDTLITTNNSTPAAVIDSFPVIENAEGSLPLFPNFSPLSGSSQLWLVHSGNYSNAAQPVALTPHNGGKFYLFDSYGGPSTAGFISRLYSNCVSLPANTGANCSYKLQFYMSHDNISARSFLDSMYVTVSSNNGVTWTRLLPGYQRYNAAYTMPGWEKLEKDLAAFAGQTVQFGFEGVSKHGNAFGLDDITIASTPAQGVVLSPAGNNGVALTRSCDDQGWTYYSNPEIPAAGLFAINWDPAKTGENAAAKASTTLTIQVDPALFAAEDILNKNATYTMRRYWNLNAGASTLTNPVNIRFFYDITEKTAVDNAAATFATANAGMLETPSWFKTSATDFAGDAIHVNPIGVANAIPLTNVNSTNQTINGVVYAEFDGINSFSGGSYAAGVGPSSPLPVTLSAFEAKRIGKINQLGWSTSQELNISKFIVERSMNGRNFSTIGQVAATGSSTVIHNYSFADNTPLHGINYYRLRIADGDNNGKFSAVRSVRNAGSVDISIYPNPAKASLNLKITADKADKGEMTITDITGKIIVTRLLVLAGGVNSVPVNINKLSAGAYIMKLTVSDDVVVKEFNKQ